MTKGGDPLYDFYIAYYAAFYVSRENVSEIMARLLFPVLDSVLCELFLLRMVEIESFFYVGIGLIFGSFGAGIIAKNRWNAIIVSYIRHKHNQIIKMNTSVDEEKFRQSVSLFNDVHVEQLKNIHTEYKKLLLIIFFCMGFISLYQCIFSSKLIRI